MSMAAHLLRYVFAVACICALGLMMACSHPQRARVEIPSPPAEAAPTLLSRQDGLAVAEAALNYPRARHKNVDCSHLVQEIYDRAGFTYRYATSYELFRGAAPFARVPQPQAGDLIAWPGHVGIIIDPAQRTFYSSLRSGPGIAHYDRAYWRRRGQARLYRYLQSSSADLR
jgi:hypothetical protein